MTKLARSIVICLAFALLVAGCGLPTVAYLYPPDMDVNNTIISIQNDSRNYESSEGSSQTYRGVEVFYRVFQNETSASTITATLNDYLGTYSDNPDGFINLVTGSTYKFGRLRNSNNRSQPLIPIDASDGSTFYIQLKDFNSASDWILTDSNNVPLSSGSVDISHIIRTLDSSSSETSFYKKDFKASDDDYSGSTGSVTDTYYIIFFAVSYGIDQATVGQTVYSIPNTIEYTAY